jgi:hypothetical protein
MAPRWTNGQIVRTAIICAVSYAVVFIVLPFFINAMVGASSCPGYFINGQPNKTVLSSWVGELASNSTLLSGCTAMVVRPYESLLSSYNITLTPKEWQVLFPWYNSVSFRYGLPLLISLIPTFGYLLLRQKKRK